VYHGSAGSAAVRQHARPTNRADCGHAAAYALRNRLATSVVRVAFLSWSPMRRSWQVWLITPDHEAMDTLLSQQPIQPSIARFIYPNLFTPTRYAAISQTTL
jgi:hypothetical protein